MVNFAQGYLETVGYLYFSVEKKLILINPNSTLFTELSPTPISVTLPDILTKIYETKIKVTIKLG